MSTKSPNSEVLTHIKMHSFKLGYHREKPHGHLSLREAAWASSQLITGKKSQELRIKITKQDRWKFTIISPVTSILLSFQMKIITTYLT